MHPLFIAFYPHTKYTCYILDKSIGNILLRKLIIELRTAKQKNVKEMFSQKLDNTPQKKIYYCQNAADKRKNTR